MACRYRDSLGKPGIGMHTHFLGIAVVDFVGTILICALISKLSGWRFWTVLFVVFVLTVFIHRLFCVNTTLNKLIFGTV